VRGDEAEADLSGRELAAAFHREVVGPLLARALPRLRYAAARLGSGSDVLGLDDTMSRDHDWGCRAAPLHGRTGRPPAGFQRVRRAAFEGAASR
jgi:hypothetical protein